MTFKRCRRTPYLNMDKVMFTLNEVKKIIANHMDMVMFTPDEAQKIVATQMIGGNCQNCRVNIYFYIHDFHNI
jgi:hypothetical protein